MKLLAVSVVSLPLEGPARGGTASYIASLIEALDEISARLDLCLLDQPHSGLSEKPWNIRRFPIDRVPGLLHRHWLSWRVGVKASVWEYRSAALRQFLQSVAPGAYDAAIFLEENAAVYGRFLPSDMPKILVRHNLDSESTKIDTRTLRGNLGSRAAKYLSRRFDRWTLRDFSTVTIGTESERQLLQRLDRAASVALLPTITRFDLPQAQLEKLPAENRFKGVFIGGFGYPPNTEAVFWFIGCQAFFPADLLAALEIILIGRSPPQIPASCKIKITSLGFVDDLGPVLAGCQFGIVPIISGSGVKVKSLTLLGSGLPVVTTSEGINGIAVTDGVECLVADDHKGFAGAVDRLFRDPGLRDRLQRNAARFLQENFSAARQNEILREIIAAAMNIVSYQRSAER